MELKQVVLCQSQAIPIQVKLENSFEFVKRTRLIDRLIKWLKKHKYISQIYSTKIYRSYGPVTIDFSNIEREIIKHYEEVFNVTGKHPKRLVIGSRYAFDLRCQLMNQAYFLDNAIVNLKEFYGMELDIVPWIDGFFILP